MNKRIIIEDGLNLYNATGTGQYTKNIYNMLLQLGYEVEMKRKPFLEKIKNSTIKRILYIMWLNFIFPFKVIFKKADKIIFTNTITPVFKISDKKYYPVLHDLWAYKSPDTVTFTQSLYTKVVIFSIKNTYEKIITVSETVKGEIIDFFKCSPDDVRVIYNYFSFGENPEVSLSLDEQNKILRKYNIENKKYILSVATLNKRKNIPMLIDAYNELKNDEIKLVLVGGASSQKFNNTNKNVIFTGYIPDGELKVLYKNALIYAFPSIYEGFGIPIIDAQSFGVPVICSDIPIFKEIGGNSVAFCEITKEDIKEKLIELLNNPQQSEDLVNKGLENVKTFSANVIKEQIKEMLCTKI